jgi:serine/threonine-protein kinase HipA
VVERYDRLPQPDGTIQRVHQEDMCQALGVPPTGKYQNEGGPGAEQIMELLRRAASATASAGSARAMASFLDALAFNWIIAGTDAHAKNYSILLSGAQVRLAPMYDVASALPYDDRYVPKLKMAMRIGGEYSVNKIDRRHWCRFAEAVGFDPERTLRRIGLLATHIGDAFVDVARSASVRALASDLPGRLCERVTARAYRCRTVVSG